MTWIGAPDWLEHCPGVEGAVLPHGQGDGFVQLPNLANRRQRSHLGLKTFQSCQLFIE